MSMTINEATTFIHDKAKEFGFKDLTFLPIRQNNRLRTCLGKFKYCGNDPISIELSGRLLKGASDDDIRQVCLHELAHAIVHELYGPCTKPHGQEFKDICEKIGCFHKGATNEVKFCGEAAADDYRYVLECPQCGNQWFYKTACKKIQFPDQYKCHCGCEELVSRKIGG